MLVLAVLVIASLVMAGCGFTAPSKARAKPTPGPPQPMRLVFVGASVTTGKFATTASQDYSELVVQSLDTQRWVNVTRLATSGATVHQALTWNVGVRSDVVIVQLGTNDYLQNASMDSFGRDYRTLLSRIRAASPRAVLLCISTWGDPNVPNGAGLSGSRYDGIVKKACAARSGRYVDISGVYTDPANHGPDGRATFLGPADQFHPNDRGHEAIAFAVLTALSPSRGGTSGESSPLGGEATRSSRAGS